MHTSVSCERMAEEGSQWLTVTNQHLKQGRRHLHPDGFRGSVLWGPEGKCPPFLSWFRCPLSLSKWLQALRAAVVVQSLSRVWLCVTPWTVACQASLSFTISQSLFKLISIDLAMPSNHLILCHPLLLLPSIFHSIRVFLMSWLLTSGGQSIGASTSALVLPVNI